MTDTAKSPTVERNDAALIPPVDVYEDAAGITLYADLPGVPKDRLALQELFSSCTVSDYFIDKSLIFARNNLQPDEFGLYSRLFQIISGSLPRPDLLVREEMALPGPGPALRLIPTPGHSADHLSLYDPHTAALWAGDILSDVEIPCVISSLADYERTLAGLAALDIRALVPGHGHPAGDPAEVRRRIEADAGYLAALRAGVEAALRDRLTIGEAVARLAGQVAVRQDMAEVHRLNVETAYIELGGPGNPIEVGWGRSFATMAD